MKNQIQTSKVQMEMKQFFMLLNHLAIKGGAKGGERGQLPP